MELFHADEITWSGKKGRKDAEREYTGKSRTVKERNEEPAMSANFKSSK